MSTTVKMFLFASVVLFISCAHQTALWDSRVLYTQEKLGNDRLAEGTMVWVLPLVIDSVFDTTDILSEKSVIQCFKRTNPYLYIVSRRTIESEAKACVDSVALFHWYEALSHDKMIDIVQDDTLWNCLKTNYIVLCRLLSRIHIRSLTGIDKRKALIDVTMWATKTKEIVWNCRTNGTDISSTITDRQFIINGIMDCFAQMPQFIPTKNTEQW